MIGETYGKMPQTDAENQIIMEYESMIDLIAQSTTFNQDFVSKELGASILAWMQSVPDLSY